MSSLPEWAAWPEWPTRLERRRISLEDYLSLPQGMHAEYVDGEVIVSPPASQGHNLVQRWLANAIETGLPRGLAVVTEAGWRHAGRFRIPDIAVFEDKDPGAVYDTRTPILVAEVLSPSTASEDTVRKSGEYQRAGVAHYWILDPTNRTFVAFRNNGHGWDRVIDLDDDHPRGAVEVEGRGEVSVDLKALLGRRALL